MRSVFFSIFVTLIATHAAYASSVTSAIHQTPVADQKDQQIQSTNGLPDNPSLWRVLMYKSGQALSKTGDVIQETATESQQNLAQNSQNAGKELEKDTQNASVFVKDKTAQAKTYTQQKWQQGKEAVLGTPVKGGVPIEQGTLSQPVTTPHIH